MLVLKNDATESLTFLHLPERHQDTLDELHVLMRRSPRVITDTNALESKFLEYQATSGDELPAHVDEDDRPMCIDHIWHPISKQIDLYSGQPRFKHLAEFGKCPLLIFHSNSYCESIFSTIRNIYTKSHASTSV